MFKNIEITDNLATFKLHGVKLAISRTIGEYDTYSFNDIKLEGYYLYLPSDDFSIFREHVGGVDNEDFDKIFNGSNSDTGERPRIKNPELISNGFKLTVDNKSYVVKKNGDNSTINGYKLREFVFQFGDSYNIYDSIENEEDVRNFLSKEEPYATIKLDEDGVLELYQGHALVKSSDYLKMGACSFYKNNSVWVITNRKDMVEEIYYDYVVYFTMKQLCGHTIYILRKCMEFNGGELKWEF